MTPDELEVKLNMLETQVQTLCETVTVLSDEIVKLNNPVVDIPYWTENENAKLPEKQREGDAGYDAYINEDKVIKAHSADKITLSVGFAIPMGYGAAARNRSGNFLGTKYPSPINIGNAWVDSNYRGYINALVQNVGDKDVEFKAGERVCSIDFYKLLNVNFVPVDEYCEKNNIDKDMLMNTNRGASGFGSTGV